MYRFFIIWFPRCNALYLPLVIFSAVYLAILFKARRLIFQLCPTLRTLETRGVPLLLHGAEVILVSDPDPAASAQGGLPALAPGLTGLNLKNIFLEIYFFSGNVFGNIYFG